MTRDEMVKLVECSDAGFHLENVSEALQFERLSRTPEDVIVEVREALNESLKLTRVLQALIEELT